MYIELFCDNTGGGVSLLGGMGMLARGVSLLGGACRGCACPVGCLLGVPAQGMCLPGGCLPRGPARGVPAWGVPAQGGACPGVTM